MDPFLTLLGVSLAVVVLILFYAWVRFLIGFSKGWKDKD